MSKCSCQQLLEFMGRWRYSPRKVTILSLSVSKWEPAQAFPTCPSNRKDDLSLDASSLEDTEDSSCGLALKGERDGRPVAGVPDCTNLLTGMCSPLFRLAKIKNSFITYLNHTLISLLPKVWSLWHIKHFHQHLPWLHLLFTQVLIFPYIFSYIFYFFILQETFMWYHTFLITKFRLSGNHEQSHLLGGHTGNTWWPWPLFLFTGNLWVCPPHSWMAWHLKEYPELFSLTIFYIFKVIKHERHSL